MVRLSGVIWGSEQESFVYAIFRGEKVYFGETGDLPPKRWGGHLAAEGTFTSKLKTMYPTALDTREPTVFIAVCCDVVSEVDKVFRKLARRAIEEELHRRFLLNMAAVYPAVELLSSMPPSPIRLTFPFDPREVAANAYDLIASQYQSWRERNCSTGLVAMRCPDSPGP